MRKIMIGQILLILCCVFYLIWWYRGFRPGTDVSRIGGLNGVLLLITAALGITGVVFCLLPVQELSKPKLNPMMIIICGIAAYVVLLLITRFGFRRVVTTELFLIVGWTVLEMTLINKLSAGGALSETGFLVMCIVIAAAFIVSIILYVAYYRMEEMKAFYAAMVPLITEASAMAVLVGMLACKFSAVM